MAVVNLRKRAISRRGNLEEAEQIALVKWLQFKKIPFYHIPNGGYRDIREAAKLTRLGVSAGVPDLCITVANKYHYGLYIEMKRRDGGVVSARQREWIDVLLDQGYLAAVCHGWDDAKKLVESYMKTARQVPLFKQQLVER